MEFCTGHDAAGKLLVLVFGLAAGAGINLAQTPAPGTIHTVVGSKFAENLPGPQAYFGVTWGIAVDGQGNIFVADGRVERIRRIDAQTGLVETFAGTGQQPYSGDGGPALQAGLDPKGLALDGSGDMYVSDGSGRIRRIDRATNVIHTIAGSGVPCTSGDGGPATAAGMNPTALRFDTSGNLYFIDGNRIRRIDAQSAVVTTIAGTGAQGDNGDGGPAVSATFNGPQDLDFDSHGNLIVADTNNHAIRRVDANTGIISSVGLPSKATPTALTVDSGDDIYYSDLPIGSVSRINAAGGAPVPILSSSPVTWITIAPSGAVLAVDSPLIISINLSTGISAAVTGLDSQGGDGGPAALTFLPGEQNLALDAAGDLYISQPYFFVVRKVDMAGIIHTFAGNPGRPYTFNPDGLPATQIGLNHPSDLAADRSNNLYIHDSGKILRVDGSTSIVTTVAGGGNMPPSPVPQPGTSVAFQNFLGPSGLAVDSHGRVYTCDRWLVVIDQISGLLSQVLVTISGATPSPVGCTTVSLDDADQVYVAAQGGPQIYKINPANGSAIGLFSLSISPTFLPNGAFTGGLYLSSLIVNGAGTEIFSLGSDLLRLDLASGVLTHVAGTGNPQSPYFDGMMAADAPLTNPLGFVLDRAGNIYVADMDVVRVVTPTVGPVPSFLTTEVLNAASLSQPGGGLPGGTIVSIFGSGLGPQSALAGELVCGALPTLLGGVRVILDDQPLSLLYVSDRQINLITPWGWEVSPVAGSGVEIEVNGVRSPLHHLGYDFLDAAGIFTVDGTGKGQALIINADGTLNGSQHPAPGGSSVVLYATGLGTLAYGGLSGNPSWTIGTAAPPNPPFPQALISPMFMFGGLPGSLQYAGVAPGMLYGLYQMNVQIPTGLSPGVVEITSFGSPQAVTMYVK